MTTEANANLDNNGAGTENAGVTDNPGTIAGVGNGAGAEGAMQQEGAAADGQQGQQAEGSVTYDFSSVQMPEGWVMDTTEQGLFLECIKDFGLSNEQAGSLVKYGTEYAKRVVDSVYQQYDQRIADWGEAARKELGAEFDSTVKYCGSAMQYLEKSIPGIREAMNETGAGNRVEIVRAMALLGKMINGDPGMAAGANGGQRSSGNDVIAAMYPNTDFSKYK